MQEITFDNSGITMAGNLYLPADFDDTKPYHAIVSVRLDVPMNRVVDTFSAVDYLTTLGFVDNDRIGMLGMSSTRATDRSLGEWT
jgi:dipeptidyl aminopeptidase/acylaminoacyl peptidase